MSENYIEEDLFSFLKVIVTKPELTEYDATNICVEIFQRIVPLSSFSDISVESSSVSLIQFINYSKRLMEQDQFSKDMFNKLLSTQLEKGPLHVIWLLSENNISSFERYCMINEETTIIDQWFDLYNTESNLTDEALSNPKQLATDILIMFIKLHYSYKKHTKELPKTLYSKWIYKCAYMLDNIMNQVIAKFTANPPQNILYEIISRINKNNTLTECHRKDFYKIIILKILTNSPAPDVYSACMMQALWASQHLPETTVNTFYELLKRFSLQELNTYISERSNDEFNWRYLLIVIAVTVSKFSHGPKQVEDLVQFYLQKAFEKTKYFSKLIRAILFARQACFEKSNNFKSYNEWYGNKFGIDTNFITGYSRFPFNFLMTSLSKMINFEPRYVLKCHIGRSLRVPRNSQNEMIRFKEQSQVQLAHVKKSPALTINYETFPLQSILDNCLMHRKIFWIIKYIISEQKPETFALLVQYILKEPKYSQIKEMLLDDISLINEIPQCQLTQEGNLPETLYETQSEDMFQ